MKVLFIGGTGIISAAAAELTLAQGFDLTLLTRGERPNNSRARHITGDIAQASTESALQSCRWDAVVDFVAYNSGDIERRLALFNGRTEQYVFISSASAYQKPGATMLRASSLV